MVLEGVLVEVLNHFLRPYVKNLDPSQLKVAIFSGDVLLENLELKENALDDLNLPVRVFRGYLEKLKLKIPWKSLYSSPIVAEIDGLYAIAGPASAFKYDAEKNAKENKERKEKQLKRIEEARKRAAGPKEEKQDSGFVERLITAVVRNIQITVKNIHIRYEDAVTNEARPFSFGVTLDSLFVQSTDCEYVVGGAAVDRDPASMLIYKLLQLNCLAVYWQCDDSLFGIDPPHNWMELLKRDIARPHTDLLNTIHYVVQPITLEARLQATTKPGRKMDIPQALVQITLQQVALSLSKYQFQDIMSLVESLDRLSINLKFLKYRPGVGVKERPGQWWRYAISAVTEEEVRRKLEMWSWSHIKQHREWCRQYTKIYAKRLVDRTITPSLKEEIYSLEEKLDVFNLTVCRQLAENKAAMVKKKAEEEAEKGEGTGGWWGLATEFATGFATGWTRTAPEEEKEDEDDAVPLPTAEELQEEKERMYEAIGYSETAQVSTYPEEYVAHKVSVQLGEVSVRLWNEQETIAHLRTSSVCAEVHNRPSSKNVMIQTTVGSLTAHGLTSDTSEREEGPILVSSYNTEKDCLLDLCVDVNPVKSKVSQRLKLQLLPIQIVYHADTVDAAISMFCLSKDVHLQKLSAAAALTLEDLKTQGRSGLQHAISQRKLLDLDILVHSPCLVVPQNGVLTKSAGVLVADLGQLEIKSDLRSYVPNVREATDAELDEAFYDHFTLSLTRLQVLLAGPGQDWKGAWSRRSGTSPLHVLEPTSLELGLKKSLLPNDTRLPNMKVDGELPALTLNVSDQKLKHLIQLVQSLPLPPPSLAEHIKEAGSTYSIPDQPSHLGTDSIVGTISDTLLLPPLPRPLSLTSDDEEFETASECESDEEGILHHRSSLRARHAPSATQLTLHFILHEIGILFSEHQDSTGENNPRLHLVVTSVTSDLSMRTWDMRMTASVGNLCIADHYITGSDGGPGTLLSTELTGDNQRLLTFGYSKYDPLAPHYVTEYNSTRQSITVSLALLHLNLHSDSVINLVDITRSITSLIKSPLGESEKTEKTESPQGSVTSTVSLSSSSGETSDQKKKKKKKKEKKKEQEEEQEEEEEEQEEEEEMSAVNEERELHLSVSLVGLEVGVCGGGDVGEVMSASVTGVDAQMDIFQDCLKVNASVGGVILLDNKPNVHHEKIIQKMDGEKNVLSLKVIVFKEPASCRDPQDLSLCDLNVAADVERLRIVVVFPFIARIQRFVANFLQRLKLDQSTIDSAREAASNTASMTAEALKERSSSRLKLNFVVTAPLIIVPYSPTTTATLLSLPSLSTSSSSSSSSSAVSSQRAFVANLGKLVLTNDFRYASDVSKTEIDSLLFLSTTGEPAVVDCMNITISSVQLLRVMDVEKANKVLDTISTASVNPDMNGDSHMLLRPLEFKGQIVRRLSNWCTAIPAISIACKMNRTQVQFSPVDYHDMMCVLQDVQVMTQKEESSVELTTSESKVLTEKVKNKDGDEPEAVPQKDKKGKEKEEEEGSDGVSVHVEAVVESLELLLYSGVGEVAEVKVEGMTASVDVLASRVAVKAGISGVEVYDRTPDVLYHKIVSVQEDCSAVDAQVQYYLDATKGEGAYDTSKCDLVIKIRVNRIRIVALKVFVDRILNYVRELVTEQSHGVAALEEYKDNLDDLKDKYSDAGPPKRIQLDIVIQAPEITVPLSSLSCDIVVLDLGLLTLSNKFCRLDVNFSPEQSVVLYEQLDIKLEELNLYRSVWENVGNRPDNCQRRFLEPITLKVGIQRNLSVDWYHGMPSLSIDAKLQPLLVVASGDDVESVCMILAGNLRETCSDIETTELRSIDHSVSTETTAYKATTEAKEGDEEKEGVDLIVQPFTELLVSVGIESVGVKLYFRNSAILNCEDESTWQREENREFAEMVLEKLQAEVKKESSGDTSVDVTLANLLLQDLRTSQDDDGGSDMEEEEDEEEDEEYEEGSTREISVDAIIAPEETQRELRIRRIVEKRGTNKESFNRLISLNYHLSSNNDTNIELCVSGVQMLVNVKFIEALTSLLLESTKPLIENEMVDKGGDEEEEEEAEEGKGRKDEEKKKKAVAASHHHIASPPSRTTSLAEGKQSVMKVSVKVDSPLVALLEDARQMNSSALVCQMEVSADLTRRLPSCETTLEGSLSHLSLSVAKYPQLESTIFKHVLGPLSDSIEIKMKQESGYTRASVTVPSLELILSPAAVRVVLNSLQSLGSRESKESDVGETAPVNLWSGKSIKRGRLSRKWYLREATPTEQLVPYSSSLLTAHLSTTSSDPTQFSNESFELTVTRISVVIEQEKVTTTLRTFPAVSLTMGKYSSTALSLHLRNWSSKMEGIAELYVEASYYNIRNDSWEPILEPVLDRSNENKYMSWGMKANIVRQPPSSTHHKHHSEEEGMEVEVRRKEDKEEEEEEEEEAVGLSVEMLAKSPLQLTLTKTSLSIFTELLRAYTETKPMMIEEVDVPETLNAAFTVVNKLGKNCPVTVKTSDTLKVHGAFSPILRQNDTPLPLHPTEGVPQMKPGELLPRDDHLSRVHIIHLQMEGYESLEVALGMYERIYYPLTLTTTSSDKRGGGGGLVVDIDRTAGTPIVTLRSGLQVHNHLDQSVAVHHCLSNSPPSSAATESGLVQVPPNSCVPLPLSASGGGFLFFQLPLNGLSQPPVQWSSVGTLDIACTPTRAEVKVRGQDKKKVSFIHTSTEEEEYSKAPPVTLSPDRAHHVVHLHHPMVIHNLLPYSISLGEEGYNMVLIGSGCHANINYNKLSQTKKFLIEVEKKDRRWIGSIMMGSKSDEETPFTVTHDSTNLDLVVRKEEKGTWQLSIFSRNWMVNKTGLSLQYRAPEGFFPFGQKPTDLFTHNAKSTISLYPHQEVCVRVVKGERYSEWSKKFSLEALGSEGIFTCSFKQPSEDFMIGTKVDLSQFGTTRILTLSPFYLINNTTRDSISFHECGQHSKTIYTVSPGKLLPFWPSPGCDRLEVSLGDDTMTTGHSSPFKFTETGSILIRTYSLKVPAVVAEVQVTGSANIVTFTPYYPGCVPLQLVNHTQYDIPFQQLNGPPYQLKPQESLMYTWDLPLGERALLFNNNNRLTPQNDGSGNFILFQELFGSSSSGSVSTTRSTTSSSAGESLNLPEEEIEEEEEEVVGKEVGLEEMEVEMEKTEEGATGTEEVDFSMRNPLRKIYGVQKNIRRSIGRKPKRRRQKIVHWISFMDGLQRVLLLTEDSEIQTRAGTGQAKELPHTELSLSLIGTGISLVDDLRGLEVAYIGIPQSQKEWQIRIKKLWKSLPPDISEKLEQLYDTKSQKLKGRKILPNSNYEVDFGRMYLYGIKSGVKTKLRRSHFEGVYALVSISEHLTSVSVRVSHVQVDNQLPLALHPIIIHPYPPPPSIASSCAPKPFIEGTLVIHKTEQSNITQIQFLQVLIQEIGVNVDMSFIMTLLGLFSQLPSSSTEAQIVRREVEYAKLPLRVSKVAAVSAAVSRNYFKLLHLSPLIIHLSFSLEMTDREGEEAKKATETNIFLSMIFNVLLSFATIVGKTKDAELKLRYFELGNEALTQQALLDRVTKHYVQEGVIQMYSVVLGLEVLGNPVGFVRGLKTGTVGLFYHPLQGAVLGPEEFLEGVVLGGRQFVGGTVGGISGVLGKVTGVLGDTAASLTMDSEYQSQRKKARGSVGQSIEGAAKGMVFGVTGVISQPIKGAMKEGVFGLVKGAAKGVLGLVLRPTGGLIDLTSATFNAVQRRTKVGDYDISQLRPARFIGQPKVVYPYSPHKAAGYALFLALDNGRLRDEGDVYFDYVELEEEPTLKNLLITNSRFLVIKTGTLFGRFEEKEVISFSDMCGNTVDDRRKVIVPVREGQGWFLGSKKRQETTKSLEVPNNKLAKAVVKLVNQAYQEHCITHCKTNS